MLQSDETHLVLNSTADTFKNCPKCGKSVELGRIDASTILAIFKLEAFRKCLTFLYAIMAASDKGISLY